MNKSPYRFAVLAILGLLLLLGLFIFYLPGLRPTRVDESTTPLTDLHSIEELQTIFNQAAGVPRLILVLSPT